MATRTLDDVATGKPEKKLYIAGRPKPGHKEQYVFLESPGDPVLMHYRGRQVPHYRRDCPNCTGEDEPHPLWYVGSQRFDGELVIVELSAKCMETAEKAARYVKLNGKDVTEVTFCGLIVTISRHGPFEFSPRILRCEQRMELKSEWAFNTRHELARIWGVPVKPRLYKEQA